MTLIGIYNLANLQPAHLWEPFLKKKGFPLQIASEVIRLRILHEEGYVSINMDSSEVKYFPEYPKKRYPQNNIYLLHDFTEWGELTARMNLMGKYVNRSLEGVYMSGNSMEVRDHTGKVRIKVGGQ